MMMWSEFRMITDYHAKYFAHELSRRHSAADSEKLAGALFDAQVDLNPHQVSAALFAFKSPLSKGAILADEVGLGKTIEAGLVLSQKWAEGKRRILIITPASLRKQWVQEMKDKFFLPAMIMEAKNYNRMIKDGVRRPFEQPDLILCSFQFAARHGEDLMVIPWDLVIIDEAHRLRNVFKPTNKIGRALRSALLDVPKVLLTATPLQNSLLELYGLVSFIDEYAFGDVKSFRNQYARLTGEESFSELKRRLEPVCHRTLRRQVLEYIRYTNRIAITEEFVPTEEEQTLYDLVSDYLRRPNLQALPSGQRSLMTLIMRKLLASSTFAIAGTLDSLARKLERQLKDNAEKERHQQEFDDELSEDFEEFDEVIDEWPEDDPVPAPLTEDEIATIKDEIVDLKAFRDLAVSITENAKGEALLKALTAGFKKASDLGAADKTIIFTESRRTQDYILQLLNREGYEGQIVLFNGSNSDEKSREVYATWKEANKGSYKISGSRTADIRAAIVEYFRDDARIMIATEAAAEGINLQFCSMVVNYDLPWNPQRIEQRIGRCHRYGQLHDVVVVNFLNKKNAADQRVYELLSEKFKLFSGVFGASDEVLGAIESGVEFEKRIVSIYQNCRTSDEIQMEFDFLQKEMEESISERLDDTRRQLLENFDAEVHEKLRINMEESTAYLDRYENMLWNLTRHELDGVADFRAEENHGFKVTSLPSGAPNEIPLGNYCLSKVPEDNHRYRLGHPLAQFLLKRAATRQLPVAELTIDYSGWNQKAIQIEDLVGHSGIMVVGKLAISGSDAQDHMLFAGVTNDGKALDSEQVRRILQFPATIISETAEVDSNRLKTALEGQQKAILHEIETHRAQWFDDEMEKLDHWAADKRNALKGDLKDLDDQITELKKQVRTSGNLQEKLGLQRKAKALETKRDTAWREYDEQARVIEKQKDDLLDEVEERLQQDISDEILFTVRWRMK
jgi:superfamily II DNA or RNA helicase